MFRFALSLSLICSGASALAADAAADPTEERLRATIARLPAAEQAYFAKATYAGQYPLSRLVSFTTREGRLVAAFDFPDAVARQFTGVAPLMLAVEGSPHLWALHRGKSGTLDEGLSRVTLTCYAPSETWPFNRFSLSSDGQGVWISAAQMFGKPAWQQSLSLVQTTRDLQLAWRLEAERYQAKRVEGPDLAALSARAPSVMETYLMPVLRRLGPARPACDIYRVFDQIPADREVVRRVRPLLGRLESGDPSVRDAAARSLKEMGRPAVLACLRIDPATLSPEQWNRLNAFFAADGWVRVTDVAAARCDVGFLTACLEDEDERVRTAAANTLAALKAVRGLGK
jgi:hypothetical protein